ncbi:MAG: HAD-IIA family hydrolase [Candidatus Cloacimonetes bacterium]|nr:HAD-IIA family hydrolase [Candidatus Cloacimonadota bacterium]
MTKGFLFDMDGTIFLEDQAIDGAIECFDYLNKKQIPYCLFTNNSSNSKSVYVKKLHKMGFDITSDKILTSGLATILYLKRRSFKNVFLMGTDSLKLEFVENGINLSDSKVDAVVLAFDKGFNYQDTVTAHKLIQAQTPFIATHPDKVCPMRDGDIPDCGAMISYFESSTGVSPEIIGKPYPIMAEMASELLNEKIENLMVIGDRLYTDIEMGIRSGAKTCLLFSGETKKIDLKNSNVEPDYCFESIKDFLVKYIQSDQKL